MRKRSRCTDRRNGRWKLGRPCRYLTLGPGPGICGDELVPVGTISSMFIFRASCAILLLEKTDLDCNESDDPWPVGAGRTRAAFFDHRRL